MPRSLLGRPFALTGEIVRGAGRGATVLFPTLNLAPGAGTVAQDRRLRHGNLARRQALSLGHQRRLPPDIRRHALGIESHSSIFRGNVTKGRLEVRFWERLRDERKFSGPAELRAQIAADLRDVREYFRRHGFAPTHPVRS